MAVDPNIKILVVEDSKITRKMEVKALKEVGFDNVAEADDGLDAVERLKVQPDVGLIISDWNMPNMDGYELLVWVRGSENFKNIPFIMATARGEKKQSETAVQAGVSDFLTKPFSPPELKAVIESVFAPKDGREAEAGVGRREVRIAASGKLMLNVAHIQITDHLTLGVLKHLIQTEKLRSDSFELETVCMPSWNPVQRALEKGEVDAAFVLAPIAMDLFAYGVPLKLILLAHKNGSIAVQGKKGAAGGQAALKEGFKQKTFYIPHELSIHHMLSHMFLRAIGLSPGSVGRGDFDVFFEVVPPVKMPEFLGTNPDACGFMVAEPLGTKAIAEGSAQQLFLSGELWSNHPCCVVAMRDEVIASHPTAVQEFVGALVEAGRFIAQKPETAAEIGVSFLDPKGLLGLKVPILRNVLKEAQGIRTDDLFPVVEDLDRIQDYMVNEIGVGSRINLEKFVDLRFAEAACGGSLQRSMLHDVSSIIANLSTRTKEERSGKAMLGIEGKYLTFKLDSQEYGLGILSVKEIIGVMPITTIPKTPSFVKGVINLRGKVIPVLDLRLKFGLAELGYNERTCIIVIEINGRSGTIHSGIIVDSVSDVLSIKAEDTEEAPMFGVGIDTSYILSMAKVDGGVKIMLDTDRLFSDTESRGLAAVA
ncbi:MAG: chemotaxis protein CheW [Deltaproteobacteria bacterium]|nr:chemotaxis protein CheW [Deltaproteobacteria bacterium]